jgi:hypothetical protein
MIAMEKPELMIVEDPRRMRCLIVDGLGAEADTSGTDLADRRPSWLGFEQREIIFADKQGYILWRSII